MELTSLTFILVIKIVQCEWIEIPQKANMDENITKKTDYSLFILTTTSTTTQTPIFAKPFKFKSNNTNNYRYNGKIITGSTTSETPFLITDSGIPKSLSTLAYVRKENNANSQEISEHRNTVTTSSIFQRNLNVDSTLNSNLENNINEPQQTDEYNYSYSSFIPYLSQVQNDLMRNAHKNKKSKLNVLQRLRDHLLIEIESRIGGLWKPETEGRSAREFKDDSHLDFPSNESALITIGFLTFAVFLIKLVMHLIQTVGTATTTPTTTAFIRRLRRDAVNDDIAKILNHIEQFTLK